MTEPRAPYTTAADNERKPWRCKCGYPLGSVLRDTLTITAEEPAGLTVEVGPGDRCKVTCPECGGVRRWGRLAGDYVVKLPMDAKITEAG